MIKLFLIKGVFKGFLKAPFLKVRLSVMKKIITIGREYGAGGRSVGKIVAEKMGISYYDRDLIMKTAEELSYLTADDVRKWEESVPINAGLMQSLFDQQNKSLGEMIWHAQLEAIRKIADKESCVIVGRNAGFILREFDHLLRVYIYAEKDWRVKHMQEISPEMDLESIKSKMNAIDKKRHAYIKMYTGDNSEELTHYDLTLNSRRLGFEKAAELIISAAENI